MKMARCNSGPQIHLLSVQKLESTHGEAHHSLATFIILKSAFGSFDIVQVAINWPLVLIFFTSLLGLIKYNLDVIWIIPPAGLIGYLFL